MKNTFKYVYFAGLLLAIIGVFVQIPYLGLLLALLGILVGIFYFDSADVVNFGIRYLLLGAVYSVLGEIPAVGTYLSGIFGAVFAFLGPVALTLLVMYFINKYFMAKPSKKK